MYRPIDRTLQMNTPAMYYSCEQETVSGRDKKTYKPAGIVKGHYKEKGGSETEINGVKIINKQITFTCWYDPKIKQNGKFLIYDSWFEITNVEDVEMRHRYMICELESIEAGA